MHLCVSDVASSSRLLLKPACDVSMESVAVDLTAFESCVAVVFSLFTTR